MPNAVQTLDLASNYLHYSDATDIWNVKLPGRMKDSENEFEKLTILVKT